MAESVNHIEARNEWIRNNIQTFSDNRLRHLVASLFTTMDGIRAKDDCRQNISQAMTNAGLTIRRL